MAWAPDYVALTDLKSFLRIADTQDDTQLAMAITTASRSIDTHCNRQFGNVTATRSYVRAFSNQFTTGQGFWSTYLGYDRLYYFSVDDIATTTGLQVVADGVTLTTSQYALMPINALASGEPCTHVVVQNPVSRLDVTATFGWTAIPVPVQQAALLQASRIFSRRNSPYGISGSPENGGELRLLAKVDPDVAVALKGFSRIREVFA